MSGPPYPHPRPAPGSNAVGAFVIGVSPIGDISPYDVWTTIISQYANSPRLDAIIQEYNATLDQTANLDSFYDLIWDIDSAQGYGLDVWGRIVGVRRVLQLPSASSEYFGFNEASSWTGFNQGGPFFSGGSVTDNLILTDTNYRTLILAKAAANICDGSIPAVNSILLALFPGRGPCYVTDGENMTMTYTFGFALTPIELAIVLTSGVLPKPVGVAATVVQP